MLDGEVLNLPYEDGTFDVVLSGHVVGDAIEAEIAELTSRGFEWFRHESAEGGIIYDYRKKIRKV